MSSAVRQHRESVQHFSTEEHILRCITRCANNSSHKWHQQCRTADCRPVGQLFAPYMPFSGSQGLVTAEQDVVLLLVWSEPVTGLTANSFSVSGPSVTGSIISGLKLLRGTNTYYHLTVNLPGSYYGAVTVSLQVSFAVLISHYGSVKSA